MKEEIITSQQAHPWTHLHWWPPVFCRSHLSYAFWTSTLLWFSPSQEQRMTPSLYHSFPTVWWEGESEVNGKTCQLG